jgi:glucosylceramidase
MVLPGPSIAPVASRLLGALLATVAAAACSDLSPPTGPSPLDPSSASVWLTTRDAAQLLAEQPQVRFVDAGADTDAEVTIEVDGSRRFQEMSGFGAAVTGSSAWLIHQKLPESRRRELMQALFDAEKGVGLSFVRTTMGASDFSLRDYTYADVEPGGSDLALDRFSIGADREAVLPVLKEARRVNPALKVMATPWSAPAWMKTAASWPAGRSRRKRTRCTPSTSAASWTRTRAKAFRCTPCRCRTSPSTRRPTRACG